MSHRTNFLLGVGAQKCGTSWLSDYLSSHPNTTFSQNPTKEFHFFDDLNLPGRPWLQRRVRRLLALINSSKSSNGEHHINNKEIRNKILKQSELITSTLDISSYLSFFRTKISEETILTGEITPAYATLSKRAFIGTCQQIDRQYNLRVILILRDPLHRLWSGYGQFTKSKQKHLSSSHPERITLLKAYLAKELQPRSRSDYIHAGNLIKLLPIDKVLVVTYESLFTDSNMRLVCEFLGIDYHTPNFSRMVNATEAVNGPPDELIDMSRSFLAEQYQFCKKMFGHGRFRHASPRDWVEI